MTTPEHLDLTAARAHDASEIVHASASWLEPDQLHPDEPLLMVDALALCGTEVRPLAPVPVSLELVSCTTCCSTEAWKAHYAGDRSFAGFIRAVKDAARGRFHAGCVTCHGKGCPDCDQQGTVRMGFSWSTRFWDKGQQHG